MAHSEHKLSYKDYDSIFQKIADYVVNKKITNKHAYKIARYLLMDSLGCAILATKFKTCTQLLGPIVPNQKTKNGARVPGFDFELDPVQGAFNIGVLIRWSDFNDAFLASEWGHPSDNLGGILAVADYLNRNGQNISMHNILTCMIKAHEIQGIMSLENSFNRVGFDHVILVKLATAAVTMHLLGGNKDQICAVQSQVWMDSGVLRAYRHAPNVGSRKSWAAGDATSRAVWLSIMTMRGEQGYSKVLTTPKWGFYDVNFNNKEFKLAQKLDSYVMENVLFKAVFPAEFHSQTAVEAAIALHPLVKDKLNQIKQITIRTHESAMRIINKTGKLNNPADRDHCIQYMIAIGLIFGELNAEDFEEKRAKDSRIDKLRKKMEIKEDKNFSKDYLDPKKRSISNALQIFFNDGSKSKEIVVEYPYGHPRRREEVYPLLIQKFNKNLSGVFSELKIKEFIKLFLDEKKFLRMQVKDFMTLWVKK